MSEHNALTFSELHKGIFNSGLDSGKGSPEGVGDAFLATDTGILYISTDGAGWTAASGNVETGTDGSKGTPTNDGDMFFATDTEILYVGVSGSWVSATGSGGATVDTEANLPGSSSTDGEFYWSTDRELLRIGVSTNWVLVTPHDKVDMEYLMWMGV